MLSLSSFTRGQPDASVVIARLLDWISRCDVASQTAGAAKPAFETPDGEPIFPLDDDPWWLTDVSKRVSAEDRDAGDEDGPPSEAAEEDQRQEVTDSDAESGPEGPSLPVHITREPLVAWRR